MANILLEQAFKALEDVQDEIEVNAKDLYESKEEYNLPKEVIIDAHTMDDLGIDSQETDGDEISEILSDYLSDEYGFCHYGFNFDVEGDHINVYDIKWDTTESLDKYITEEDDLKESCSDKELVDKLVAYGTCDTEEEAERRVSKMSQEMKDEMCKSLSAQAKDHLLNDSLKEEKHVCEKCGKEVCECDKKLNEEPANTTTTISVLDDGEKVLKQVGYSALTKKIVNGKPVYTVKYAPGYIVNTIEAKHDKEAISRFLGLKEGLREELEMDYYVVSYGNPKNARVFSKDGKDSALATAKELNSIENKEGNWEVYHYTKPFDGELKYDIITETCNESKEEYEIEYWVDEDARDHGLGDIATERFSNLEDAKEFADKLFGEVASVEVLDSKGEVVYGRYPEDESLKESHNPSFSELEEWCMNNPVEMIKTIRRIRSGEMTDGDREVFNDFGFDSYSEEELKNKLDELENSTNSWIYDSGDFSEEEIAKIEKELEESLKENLSKDEKSVSEEHKEDEKVVCAECGSEEVKFNDPETKEPLCDKCYQKKVEKQKEEEKKSLDESITVNINDEEAVKDAKKELEVAEKKADEEEIVVDVDADSVEDLKDSYVGNYILSCDACKTLIYKKPDAVKKDEESGVFNVGEACPHCGSESGYSVVGQVAKASVEVEPEDMSTTGAPEAETKEETKVEVEKEEEKPVLPSAMESMEQKSESTRLEKVDLNEQRFDRLVNKFVHATYENVDKYETKNLYLDDDNTLIVEGVIKYTSGKEREAQFKLCEKKLTTTKEDVIALNGICEAFNTTEKAFTFRGVISENKLNFNSLTYNFNTKVLNESKNIKGKVCIKY